jgi:hypothetical protein
MKHLFICVCLSSIGWLSASGQTSAELQKRNGFKDIKLGSFVDSVKGVLYKKDLINKEGQISKLYTVDDVEYRKIGEVMVKEIELTSYKGFIYSIKVTTDKDLRLMKGMEMALGKAEWDVRNEQYAWRADKLSLSYKSVEKDKIELTYTSFPVLQKMKEDKKKELEDIADDF